MASPPVAGCNSWTPDEDKLPSQAACPAQDLQLLRTLQQAVATRLVHKHGPGQDLHCQPS